jgi:nucleoid-associated protein YgaU
MYKILFMVATFLIITACAGTSKNDDMSVIAEEKYNAASVLVDKAKSYNLNIGEAENQLAQARTQIEEEKYDESIVSSEEAGRLAANAIEVYQYAEAKTAQYIEAAKFTKEEQSRIAAAEAKHLSQASTNYVVQPGDTLWSIAAKRKELNHDALCWPLIYNENQTAITNPDLIHANMVLRITAPTQPEQTDKAGHYAQTRGDANTARHKNSDQYYLQQ